MPTDAREAARRIVVEVFGPGEDARDGTARSEAPGGATGTPASVEPEVTPVHRPTVPVERPMSAAQRRAQELVSEVFDPPEPEPEPEPPPPRPPTAAELAGRRIAAEAEAAQRARAAEQAAAAIAAQRAAHEAAEAEQRARARRARAEWIAQARAEQEAEQERRRAAALAQQEQERAEQLQRESAAARAGATEEASDPHPATTVGPATAPTTTEEDPLFPGAAEPLAVASDDEELFEPEPAGLPASLTEDVDGPPAPPDGPSPLRLAESPPAPQLAARLVSDVLEARSDRGQQVAVADEPVTPTTTVEAERPRRVARWLVVTVLAAVSLAVLFPLAVRAVLQLVSLS